MFFSYFARNITRKIIYHSGPTNSGKTFTAVERLKQASSGIYCGPLRLLAYEIYHKLNEAGIPCDLVTGEERKSGLEEYGHLFPDLDPSTYEVSHIACTAEILSLEKLYEVAVIDEIQTIRDELRGWAWTKAILGLQCQEMHICGEATAIDLIDTIVKKCGDTFEVNKYERLSKLIIESDPLGSLDNLQAGDCIVCFNRERISALVNEVQKLGHEVAVIYGDLPPLVKITMAEKFNDQNNSCKIMIATDAIGMGLNLNIRRIIFDKLERFCRSKSGILTKKEISVSSALQIAGRAGRFGTVTDQVS